MELKKIWATGLAGAAIAASLAVPTVARATTVEQTVVEGLSLSTPLSELSQAPNNDELFNEYVRRLFYGDFDISLLGTSGYDQLSVDEKKAYDCLKEAVVEIAEGTRTNTDEIALPTRTYTAEEIAQVDSDDSDANKAWALYQQQFGLPDIFRPLMYDNPYELYWFDKTDHGVTNDAFYISGTIHPEGNGAYTISVTASFYVAESYQANGNPFQVDATKVGRAKNAVNTARGIVAGHEAESDREKLNSYRDEICRLVSYDHTSADDDSTPYGDPWQLVNVFDGDEDTNVVCEGYAKAFQYLCDISDFNSDIRCISVSGTMSGATGAGAHMWNVVQMDDGKNYLVDVTNSDENTSGAGGGLFIAQYYEADDLSPHQTYRFMPTGFGANVVTYTYRSDMFEIYSADDLEIASDPYTEPEIVEKNLKDATVTVGGTYTYNGSAQTPAAEDVTVTLDGEAVPQSAYTIEATNNTGVGAATVTVTAVDGEGYTGSATGTFTIASKTLIASIAGTTTKTYDGDTTVDSGLSIALEGVVGGDDVTATATFAYDDASAGERKTVKASDVKLAGNDAKSYRLDTTELTAQVGTITKATPSGGVTCHAAKLWAGASTSDVKLTWSGTPEGSAVLDDGVLEVGTRDYGWTFTPNDAANYETLTGTISLTATEDTVTGIEVTKQPTKTQYVYGEEFDPAGMAVTATYASGRTADVTGEVAFGSDLAVGQTSVSLTYYGLRTSVDIVVSPRAVTPTLELAGADGLVYTGAEHKPSVTVRDGDAVVPAGEYEVSYEDNVNAGAATVRIADAEGGNYDVAEASATFEIAKAEPALTVTAKTAEGSRDATLAVTLNGVNGEKISGDVELVVDDETYTVTVKDGHGELGLFDLAAGVQHTVTTTYAGSQNYEASTAATSFSVDKATPNVSVAYDGGTVYPSTSLDAIKAALEVTTDVPGEIELADATLSVGEQTLTWTFTPGDTANYNTVSGTVTVNVEEDTLQSIAVTTPPTKTEYVAGETFDPTGMVVTATYASVATKDVTNAVTFDASLVADQTSVTLSYEEGGTTVTCAVPVSVLVATMPVTVCLYEPVSPSKTLYDGEPLDPGDFAYAWYGDVRATSEDLIPTYAEVEYVDGTFVYTGGFVPGMPRDVGWYAMMFDIRPKVVDGVAYASSGSAGAYYYIDPAELTSDLFEAIPDQTYDGAPVEPVVTIADPDSGFLTVDDFTVTYESNAGAGTGYAVVTATEDGNFTGSVKLPFTIAASTPGPTPGGGSSTPSEPTYTPEVPETDRGEVSVTPARPHEGDTVTITPEPDEGNEVRSVTVTDEDGNVIEVTMGEDGTWSFEQPEGEVTIEVVFGCDGGDLCTSHAFPDVDHDMWYHDSIDWAVDAGAFHGYDNGSFGPDDTLTREQAAAVLWNLFGEGDASAPGASMSDVAQGQWYSAAVNWAVANGVMNGYDGTGTFGVGDALTREQFTGMVANACGADLTSVDLSVLEAYGDFEGVSGWAKRAMAWAIEAGVINGVDLPDGTRELQAGRNISRAEMAAMMKNAIDAGVLELG